MNQGFSTIFTLIIGITSIYFFYQYNFFIGIILLIWTISRLFENGLVGLFEGVTHSEFEKKSNIQIELWFNVAEILNHKLFDELLEKINRENREFIKSNGNNGGDEEKKWTFDSKEWKKKLLENYKKKYKNKEDFTNENKRYVWEKVKFNIKNNILWKDDKIFFNDLIFHEITIPYNYDEKNNDNPLLYDGRFPAGISIRMFLVNGIIKLQIGNFDKRTSPNVLKNDGLAVYQTNYTITSFPLMYIQYGIPINYLNQCDYATDSHWKFFNGGFDNEDKQKWAKELNEIEKEIMDYKYISNEIAKESSWGGRMMKIGTKFAKKLLVWRAKDGKDFKSNTDKKDDDYDGLWEGFGKEFGDRKDGDPKPAHDKGLWPPRSDRDFSQGH